jgi:hypothetical protein
MKIAIHDNEKNGYPNVALMKLSAWHKAQGHSVEWFNALFGNSYDKVYSSKVFTWTKGDSYLPNNTDHGGTGNDIVKTLPDEVEHICPDYSLYDCQKSYGFLTRGCIRNCPWCFVPKKEGMIRGHADIEEFAIHKEVILMDNNVLAHDHGIQQLEKIAKLGLKVDFNQGLDARLIDNAIAKRLAKIQWLHPVRLACDTVSQIDSIRNAVTRLRWENCTPRRYFCYVLVKDLPDAIERVMFLKAMNIDPFCQPYRDKEGTEPTQEQRWFARWVNHKALYNATTWNEYHKARLAA